MESEKINRISQHVESDATPPSSDNSVSFEITPEVTQCGDHVAYADDEDQGQIMGDVQDSLQHEEPEKIHVSPIGSL